MSGLAFSPDSRWLAWSASGPGPWEDPGPRPLRQIKVADLDRGRVIPVTSLRFTDTDPVFTLDGKHLAFLSIRSLDPVYDTFSFDLSFPAGCRPHLVALAADTPSPFDPIVGGRPLGATRAGAGCPGSRRGDATAEDEGARRVRAARARPAPPQDRRRRRRSGAPHRRRAGGGRALLAAWRPAKHGLVWMREPLRGELGDNRATVDAEPERGPRRALRPAHVDAVHRRREGRPRSRSPVTAAGCSSSTRTA